MILRMVILFQDLLVVEYFSLEGCVLCCSCVDGTMCVLYVFMKGIAWGERVLVSDYQYYLI